MGKPGGGILARDGAEGGRDGLVEVGPGPRPDPAQERHPHLHIGAAMLSPRTPMFPGAFHKKHVPTDRVSIERVVRFAIEELDVPPLRRNWSDILDRGQRRFDVDRHE